MPAKSKDQQRAAAIALKAKKEGKVNELPSGAAKNMAKSMSEKELDKFASTKHKDLPENKPNENKAWAGESLLEVFSEEMLDTDEEGEAITSDKPTRHQIEDADRDHEDDTGWDAYDDSWDSKVNADAPMAQAGRAMGSNVTGAARVSFESLERMPAKELKLASDEKKCTECYGTGYKDGHGETMSWRDSPKQCDRCGGKGKVKKETKKEAFNPNSLDILFEQDESEKDLDKLHVALNTQDFVIDFIHEKLKQIQDSDPWGDDPVTIKDAFEAAKTEVESLNPSSAEAEALKTIYNGDLQKAVKGLAQKAWRSWNKTNLSEQQNGEYYQADEYYDLTHPSEDDWNDEDAFGAAQSEYEGELERTMEDSLVDDMVQHLINHYEQYQTPIDSWDNVDLLGDMRYEYQVDMYDPEDQELAERAKKVAKERLGFGTDSVMESAAGRWQKLAGLLIEQKEILKELDSAQADRYVRRMAKHQWEWLDVVAKLQDQYGLSLANIERLKPAFEEELGRQKNEAMLGGVSNGGPAPGHRAKMNEDSDLELLRKGKAHRVDVHGVRDELAGLAYEIAGEIQAMHLDTSDRKTEKMIQNKMEHMYKFLLKLKNLAN